MGGDDDATEIQGATSAEFAALRATPPLAPPSPASTSALASVSSAQATSGAPPTVADTTLAALHAEEAARAVSFGRVAAILCALGLFGQLGCAGDPNLRIAMPVAQALLGSVGIWVWWRARDPARWSRRVFRVFCVTAALAAIVFMHYLGVFSPVTAVLIFGLSFFALGSDTGFLIPAVLALAFAYFVSALLITLDVIPDLGLFAPRRASRASPC